MFARSVVRLGATHRMCGDCVASSRTASRNYRSPTVVIAQDSRGPKNTTSRSSSSGEHPSRVVCFGGSGYIGSRVVQAALNLGAEVTSISRSGRPKSLSASWADRVKWVQGDIFDASKSWKDELRGVSGIVSTLGAFGSNEFMYQICGSANMELMDVARDVGVPRFAFISVHDYKFLGTWSREPLLLKGYFKGKRDAERHLFETFPETGIALRPTFVYGKRQLPNGVSIPLELLGAPMAAVLKLLPTKRISSVPILGAALAPPVSVDAVGRAAASSILCPHLVSPGIMDVWTISKF